MRRVGSVFTPHGGRPQGCCARPDPEDGRQHPLGPEPDAVTGSQIQASLPAVLNAANADPVLDVAAGHGDAGLPDMLRLAAGAFRRFGEEEIIPMAQEIHRADGGVPEEVIAGLGAMGAFGLSIPVEYHGSQDPEYPVISRWR